MTSALGLAFLCAIGGVALCALLLALFQYLMGED